MRRTNDLHLEQELKTITERVAALSPKQQLREKRHKMAKMTTNKNASRSTPSSASTSSNSIISEIATRITYAKNQRPPTPYPTHDPIYSSSESDLEMTMPVCTHIAISNHTFLNETIESLQESEIPPTCDTTPFTAGTYVPDAIVPLIVKCLDSQVNTNVETLRDTREKITSMMAQVNELREQESQLVSHIVDLKNLRQCFAQF